jgi:hypothetical protein
MQLCAVRTRQEMILDQNSLQDMPHLLDPGWVPTASQARRFWENLHRWRVSLFKRWMREDCGDTQPADIARLVDHFFISWGQVSSYVTSDDGKRRAFRDFKSAVSALAQQPHGTSLPQSKRPSLVRSFGRCSILRGFP